MELSLASVLMVAGIVAKGLGAIAILFFVGVLVGVVLTLYISSKVRGFRNKH